MNFILYEFYLLGILASRNFTLYEFPHLGFFQPNVHFQEFYIEEFPPLRARDFPPGILPSRISPTREFLQAGILLPGILPSTNFILHEFYHL